MIKGNFEWNNISMCWVILKCQMSFSFLRLLKRWNSHLYTNGYTHKPVDVRNVGGHI